MAAEDETPGTATDEQIIHELAKELARYDRRDHYRDEEELNRCAGFPIYGVPAKQFLIMWRLMWKDFPPAAITHDDK